MVHSLKWSTPSNGPLPQMVHSLKRSTPSNGPLPRMVHSLKWSTPYLIVWNNSLLLLFLCSFRYDCYYYNDIFCYIILYLPVDLILEDPNEINDAQDEFSVNSTPLVALFRIFT